MRIATRYAQLIVDPTTMRQLTLILIILSTTVFGQTNENICIGKKDSLYSNFLKENSWNTRTFK